MVRQATTSGTGWEIGPESYAITRVYQYSILFKLLPCARKLVRIDKVRFQPIHFDIISVARRVKKAVRTRSQVLREISRDGKYLETSSEKDSVQV